MHVFDEIDRVMISELQKDGRETLVNLSKKTGISHVAIGKRLRKLLKKNFDNISATVNPNRFGGKIAVISVEVDNLTKIRNLLAFMNAVLE